jgi:hypothetical protein
VSNTSSGGVRLSLDTETLRPLIGEIIEAVLQRLRDDAAAQGGGRRLAYTEPEAAALIGMKPYMLRDERLKRRICGSRGPRGRVLYSVADIEAYLRRRRTDASE